MCKKSSLYHGLSTADTRTKKNIYNAAYDFTLRDLTCGQAYGIVLALLALIM